MPRPCSRPHAPTSPTASSRAADETSGCPTAAPSFVCDAQPVCTSAGTTVQLADSCWATRAGATLAYVVGGQPATSAVCPPAGESLAVMVKAQIASKPGCAFDASNAFTLVSEWRRARFAHCGLGASTRLLQVVLVAAP